MNRVGKLVKNLKELNNKYTEIISKYDDQIGEMQMEIKETNNLELIMMRRIRTHDW